MDISLLQTYINNNNDMGFYDINKLLEYMSIKLFGIIYGYNLINLNEIKVNFPAIDLADEKAGVSIQVTSNATAQKIKETIKTFENEKLYEKYHTLKIYGFCKANKKKRSLPGNYNVIVMDTIDLVTKLISIHDESKVQEVIDTIRSHTDYSTIHPYDDLTCLELLLRTIDRNAIKHGMSCEGNYSDMVKGLIEITELITKGQINSKERSKPINNFSDQEIIKFMTGIKNKITKILAIINKNKRPDRDFICLSFDDMRNIDKIKIEIISSSNRISREKGLTIIIDKLYT
jgi:hypothetical protein